MLKVILHKIFPPDPTPQSLEEALIIEKAMALQSAYCELEKSRQEAEYHKARISLYMEPIQRLKAEKYSDTQT